jgi:hypothetical protein
MEANPAARLLSRSWIIEELADEYEILLDEVIKVEHT